jgi:hypothetical protein
MQRLKLPIGIQTLAQIREGGYADRHRASGVAWNLAEE